MLEFTWQSFVFACVNFLILAALLYRFLHKPLLGVLERRREGIEQGRKAAEEQVEQARQSRAAYEEKLAGAEDEGQRLLAEARERAESAAGIVLEKAKSDAARETTKQKQAYDQERREALKGLQTELIAAGVDLARQVLVKVADQDLDARLDRQLLQELDALAEKGVETAGADEMPVRVVSARELDAAAREALKQRIAAVGGDASQALFEVDGSVVAGSRVEFGTVVVDATLSDLLAGAVASAAEAEETHGTEENAS